MGSKLNRPTGEAIRQQAEQLIKQLEAISREGKSFDKSVSELLALQER